MEDEDECCGAEDINAFYENIQSKVLPDPSSVTYVGLFNQHYYDIEQNKSDKLLALNNAYALTINPFTQERETWLSTLIVSSQSGKSRGIQPIDIVVVMDISGSMSDCLSKKSTKPKIELAKQSIKLLLQKSLRSDDRFGLVTFNDEGKILQNLEFLDKLNTEKLCQEINQITAQGGTILEAGLSTGINLFEKIPKQTLNTDLNNVKNQITIKRVRRIIMITDMLDLGNNLDFLIKQASIQQVYLSIIGAGIDFNTGLTEIITKNEGTNYFCVNEDEYMQQILVEQFHYHFFPVAFNVQLRIESDDFEVIRSYGTPFDDTYLEASQDAISQYQQMKQPIQSKEGFIPKMSNQCIAEINTINSSSIVNNQIKGGLILVKLKQLDKAKISGKINLIVSYSDADRKNNYCDSYQIIINANIQFQQQTGAYYQNSVIEKGLLLQRYAEEIITFLNQYKQSGQIIDQKYLQKIKEFWIFFKKQLEQIQHVDQYKTMLDSLNQLVELSDEIAKDQQNK